jgi:hypothetical protein
MELGIKHRREGIDEYVDTFILSIVAWCCSGEVECEGGRDEDKAEDE